MSGEVSVIVASADAATTVASSLAGFLEEVGGRGEVVLVDASTDGTADEAARQFVGLRVLRRSPGRLVPELWRIGLEATDAPLVAFSTAAMRPRPGWLSALLGRLESSDAAAVGGPIEPGPGLSATNRAIYLHRYAPYRPPVSSMTEPPGDNALYRRARLAGLGSLDQDGFWEAAVNRDLRARGERLAMAEGAVVDYLGGGRLGPTLRRRVDHARRFGAWRAQGSGLAGRLARSAAAPAVPALLLARIIRRLDRRSESLGPWLSASPPLGLLLTAWAMGEAIGTWEKGKNQKTVL